MAIRIIDTEMTLTIGEEIVATARFSKHAAADGNGAWIVSTHEARLFTRNQAIIAMSLAECLAAGYGEDDPHVIGWRRGGS
jgi:hypothetical protein